MILASTLVIPNLFRDNAMPFIILNQVQDDETGKNISWTA
jgi:hypothetical protein